MKKLILFLLIIAAYSGCKTKVRKTLTSNEIMEQKMWPDAEKARNYWSLFNNGQQGIRFERAMIKK